MLKRSVSFAMFVAILVLVPQAVYAMHIAEGFLPIGWCILWGVISLPFVIFGLSSIKKTVEINPRLKMLLALAGAFVFVLSALKLPSVTGSSSHPTGVGLGAILFGPSAMSVLGLIVLIFQAALLAHGGISTIGANTFSMAVVGPFVAFGVFKLVKKLKGSNGLAVCLAAALGNLLTYITTAFQLALAHPSQAGGFIESFAKFMGVFATTQLPLAVSEGLLTVVIFNILHAYSKSELRDLSLVSGEEYND